MLQSPFGQYAIITIGPDRSPELQGLRRYIPADGRACEDYTAAQAIAFLCQWKGRQPDRQRVVAKATSRGHHSLSMF
jgi:hypothetical protein